MILTKELCFEHFDYSTNAREYTWEFINQEISGAEWLRSFCDKKAKQFAKALIRDSGGVKKARLKIKRMFKNIYEE